MLLRSSGGRLGGDVGGVVVGIDEVGSMFIVWVVIDGVVFDENKVELFGGVFMKEEKWKEKMEYLEVWEKNVEVFEFGGLDKGIVVKIIVWEILIVWKFIVDKIILGFCLEVVCVVLV